jgi:predicted nucleic acid-binding protein
MFKNIFIDANIILDLYDEDRLNHIYSTKLYRFILKNENMTPYTSCDLITTVYYINSKNNMQQALCNIRDINKTLKVIEFSNKEIEETCELMTIDTDYKDLEDTIQYILAKKYKCDLIVTNDKNFVCKDIPIISSKEFYKQFDIKDLM